MGTVQESRVEPVAEGFELGAVIHRGRRSTIQRARRQSDDRQVVLKAPLLGTADRKARRRLRHEHAMLERAAGRGTIATHGLASTSLGLSLVLDPAPGVPLRVRFGHRRLSVPDFLNVAIQITAALRSLHGAGINHLDLRPDNLISDPSPGGSCVLLDLGRASRAPIPTPEPTGVPASELIYIAPEQTGRLGRPADARSDLYALGVIFYELLAGEPPLAISDPLEFIYALIAQAPRSLDDRRPELPGPILALVGRLLKKSPDQRYQSAGGLLADLKQCRRLFDINGVIAEFEIGLADRTGSLSLSGRLYGRDEERGALQQAIEIAIQGLAPGVAVLGPTGIGKTSLVNELRTWVVDHRGWYASGKFENVGQANSYAALRSALGQVLRRILALPTQELSNWKNKLVEAVGSRSDALLPLVPLLSNFYVETPITRALSPFEAKARQQGAFLDLLRALHSSQAPLILCIDDLHWADAATIELIEGFLRAPDAGNPVLVLSWRDEEVTEGHALHEMFERVGRASLPRLQLSPLSTDAVSDLLADTLYCTVDKVAMLAQKVTERTSGNPFFVGVFLGALVNSGVVAFDTEGMAWHWRLGALDEIEISDDMVTLLTAQLATRDQPTLDLLGRFALFGGSVDLGLIALALGTPLESLVERVAQLGHEGILALDGDGWQYAGEISSVTASESVGAGIAGAGRSLFVRFPHDKVQSAARDMLPAETRAALHWEFGQRLLALGADAWGQAELFVTADQLERGHTAAPDGAKVNAAALVLRRAGHVAFSSSAFARALSWTQAAIRLLATDSQPRDLFELHLLAAQSAVVLGFNDSRDEHVAAAEPLAPDEFGLVALDQVQIRAELARGDHNAAVDHTLRALARLGMPNPRKPGMGKVAWLMMRTIWGMRGATERLRELPLCESPKIVAAIELMSEAMIAAYLSEPNLAAVFMLQPVILTLEHGMTPQSPYGIASYAFLRAAQFHDIEGAVQFSAVAREMVVRLDAKEVAAKVENLIVGFVESRSRRLIELIDGYANATRAGLEGGDSTFAAQGAVNAVSTLISAGVQIDEAEAIILPRLALCRRLGQERSVEWIALNLQMLDNLRGRADDPLCLEGQHMQVEAWLKIHLDGGDQAAPTCLHIYSAQLAVWTGNAAAGLEHVQEAESTIATLIGTCYVPLCHAYAGLIRVAAARTGADSGRGARKSLKKLEPWVVEGPVNYDHLRHLLRAEMADLAGRWDEAEIAYDAAIRLATQTGVLHETALAMELAGCSWLRRGRGRVAASYLRAALERWRDYGASAGLDRFDGLLAEAADKEGDAVAPTGYHAPGTRPGTRPGAGFDDEVVRRGAQALVGEMRLESLLKRLMRLALQVSGATSGALLLRDGKLFRVAARAESTAGALEVSAVSDLSTAAPAENLGALEAVLNFVQRTRESVVAGDVTTDPRFAKAFEGSQSLSMLATPLIRGGDLVGVVIAEQNLVAGAFSNRQLELVATLAAQAAIGVANSLLYENLQAAHDRQARLTRAYQRFVPAEFVDQLGKKSILEVKLGDQIQGEFHILFADIRGFSGIAENLGPAETFKLINEYLAVVEPAISGHAGYIKEFQGDGVLAVFSGSADDAVSGALAMHFALAKLNELRATAGHKPLRIGVGINSGTLTFGAVGGLKRMAIGVVGDAINAASRVEGLCKGYGAGLLISAHTRALLTNPEVYQMRELDRVVVVGKREVLDIWEVLDGEPEPMRSGKIKGKAAYARGIAAWRSGQFYTASAAFAEASAQSPDDLSAAVFKDRCAALVDQPTPADWDGVSRLTWK